MQKKRYLYGDKYTNFMRFALFFTLLLTIVELSAHNLCDSTLMNWGVEHPRSHIVAYESANSAQTREVEKSKYIAMLSDWSSPTQDQRLFEASFNYPFMWIGRQAFLRVERAASPYTVKVNGTEVAQVLNNRLPAEINITKQAREGANTVTITLDNESGAEAIEGWERDNSEPAITQAYVMTQPTQMIRDIAISTKVVAERLQSHITLSIKSYALNQRVSTLHYSLHGDDGRLVSFGHRNVTLSMRGEQDISFTVTMAIEEGWSAERPNMYTLKLRTQHEGRDMEHHSYRVSFRTVEVSQSSGEVLINGVPTPLSITKYGGQELLDIKTQGFNTIRVPAGWFDQSLYDKCDKVGLYVVAPMPINSSREAKEITKGKNPSNNPEWVGAYIERIEAGYYTSQIHPCVIAFSLADESRNGYNLYEGFLRLKEIEPSRPIIYFEAQGEWNTDNLKFTNL